MIAIEFAVVLLFLALAVFVMTRLFVKHSRKNDPLVGDFSTIFFRKSRQLRKKNNK